MRHISFYRVFGFIGFIVFFVHLFHCRVQFGAANHNLDFDLWTGPQKDPTDPTYVMKWTLERTRPQEEEERKQTEKVKWEEKVVVDDTKFHTLRYVYYIAYN